MANKKTTNSKSKSKEVAKILTATLAASTIVAVLPGETFSSIAALTSNSANSNDATVEQEVYRDEPSGQSVGETVYSEGDAPTTPEPTVTDQVYVPVAPKPVVPVAVPKMTLAQSLAQVQQAATVEDMKAAIVLAELGLNLSGYQVLDEVDQNTVASKLVGNKPASGYADVRSLQKALGKAVFDAQHAAGLRQAVQAVNQSTSPDELKNALERPYLGLILVVYQDLSSEGKQAVAGQVLTSRPSGGYTDSAAIQEALNTAVKNQLSQQNDVK
ncbi:hypothetical protein ACFFK0_09615 [Paenibacillus chartarius]|uniref:Uncharacterized protein n=1 Tax=Paenibacillus chartarius TaxID=747481 RepID=A0ABV6DJA1_9BACL